MLRGLMADHGGAGRSRILVAVFGKSPPPPELRRQSGGTLETGAIDPLGNLIRFCERIGEPTHTVHDPMEKNLQAGNPEDQGCARCSPKLSATRNPSESACRKPKEIAARVDLPTPLVETNPVG